ncbi:MAG: phosphate regulon sensor histidine kinase PhoR [Chromatiaceae bacterium]|nr:phosphate regulon sensor histidine kinase PhoR [Chromatiaceae bacterium]
MNPRPGWLGELWRIVLLLAGASFVGWVTGEIALWLLLALAAYTLRNLFNLHRLSRWLGDPAKESIPIHFGIWGDIYSQIARVNAHQAERESRLNRLVDEYQASTAALPDGAVAMDARGRIRWFNDAASRLLGLVTAKDIGQPLQNLFRNPEITAFLQARSFEQLLETNVPGDGSRRLEMRLAPYGDGQVLLLARDVTERFQQDRIRRDFVANVSHELRTPLTVISGFIENLQADERCSDKRLERPLELMAQQAARMRHIIEDLLLLARLEAGQTTEVLDDVDVAAMLHGVADECRALRADSPEIRCEIASRRRLRGDPKQLRSAVVNLVVNAVHHTPADGHVTLMWRDERQESVLEVRDDGEGIAPEHIPRITERFYRVDSGRSRERGGTGLGLAIVKHVLRYHAAKLEIQSQPDAGSRFICRFPPSRLIG